MLQSLPIVSKQMRSNPAFHWPHTLFSHCGNSVRRGGIGRKSRMKQVRQLKNNVGNRFFVVCK